MEVQELLLEAPKTNCFTKTPPSNECVNVNLCLKFKKV